MSTEHASVSGPEMYHCCSDELGKPVRAPPQPPHLITEPIGDGIPAVQLQPPRGRTPTPAPATAAMEPIHAIPNTVPTATARR